MNPLFQLAGRFINNPQIKTAFDQGIRGGVGYAASQIPKDPLNKAAGFLFGLPYATIPATAIMTLNAGATAPGTLDEARRLGMITDVPKPIFSKPTFN